MGHTDIANPALWEFHMVAYKGFLALYLMKHGMYVGSARRCRR